MTQRRPTPPERRHPDCDYSAQGFLISCRPPKVSPNVDAPPVDCLYSKDGLLITCHDKPWSDRQPIDAPRGPATRM
jgi:hypothetical protein